MRALLDGIRLALRAIVRSPLRASLTVLGILIGVAAVVTVTALGAGAREKVSAQIQSIGSNFIIIFPQNAQASGARGAQGSGQRLTEEDGRDDPARIDEHRRDRAARSGPRRRSSTATRTGRRT